MLDPYDVDDLGTIVKYSPDAAFSGIDRKTERTQRLVNLYGHLFNDIGVRVIRYRDRWNNDQIRFSQIALSNSLRVHEFISKDEVLERVKNYFILRDNTNNFLDRVELANKFASFENNLEDLVTPLREGASRVFDSILANDPFDAYNFAARYLPEKLEEAKDRMSVLGDEYLKSVFPERETNIEQFKENVRVAISLANQGLLDMSFVKSQISEFRRTKASLKSKLSMADFAAAQDTGTLTEGYLIGRLNAARQLGDLKILSRETKHLSEFRAKTNPDFVSLAGIIELASPEEVSLVADSVESGVHPLRKRKRRRSLLERVANW